eukprot:TRINITY_DN29724_c0_g1_i1.p1 TRINITY_DN29724_c0_g1~~TRINITY_DN29724_c0_g1_i1.p1  ORF type:complete len:283 (-),score=54.53 TRINITY_DN29724_c0_g1_i1:67-915(-)
MRAAFEHRRLLAGRVCQAAGRLGRAGPVNPAEGHVAGSSCRGEAGSSQLTGLAARQTGETRLLDAASTHFSPPPSSFLTPFSALVKPERGRPLWKSSQPRLSADETRWALPFSSAREPFSTDFGLASASLAFPPLPLPALLLLRRGFAKRQRKFLGILPSPMVDGHGKVHVPSLPAAAAADGRGEVEPLDGDTSDNAGLPAGVKAIRPKNRNHLYRMKKRELFQREEKAKKNLEVRNAVEARDKARVVQWKEKAARKAKWEAFLAERAEREMQVTSKGEVLG